MFHVLLSHLLAPKPPLVWRVLTDETLMPQWVEGLVEVERVSGQSAEVGARFDFLFTLEQKRVHGATEVTSARAEKLYALETRVGGGWLLLDTIRLEPEGGGTRLSVASELHRVGTSPLAELFNRRSGLLGAPAVRPLDAAYERSFASFKKLVDTRAERPYR